MPDSPASKETKPKPSRRLGLLMTIFALATAALAGAQITAHPTNCGPMCHPGFWRHSDILDVQTEMAHGANLTARQSPRGGTALHMAAAYATDPEIITILLDAGAQIEYRSTELSNTPLIAAALNRNPDVVAVLLERGARIDARNIDDRTALHAAAGLNPNPAVAKLLLEHDANIEERESGLGATPLHAAAALNPNPGVTRLLLEHGADIHDRTPFGDTVLHTLARLGHSPAVGALLVERGASPRIRNDAAQTPCQIAAERHDAPVGIRTLLCQ